ncbi:MAG: hydroxyacylglutathione hydrolase [Oleiphilaceae bacterium]|nr:hydroxyacylglutathione hydrolase [Oleiphilaceae bacterium]
MYQIEPIAALSDNYIWCLHDPDSGAALVVDPGEAAPVQSFLKEKGLHLERILLTHHHPDHSGGIRKLVAGHDIPVHGPAGSPYPDITESLSEGDAVHWRDFVFEVLAVPGHTLDHIAFFSTRQQTSTPLLFSGDALFVCGCGRLFEGQPEQMQHSLAKLLPLPDDTLVCCGHEYTLANLAFSLAVLPEDQGLRALQTRCQALRDQGLPTVPVSLGQEKRLNPFLRWDDKNVIESADRHAAQSGLPVSEGRPDLVFAALRHWKDHF